MPNEILHGALAKIQKLNVVKTNKTFKNYSSLIIGVLGGTLIISVSFFINNFLGGYVMLLLFILTPIFGLVIKEKNSPIYNLIQRFKSALIVTGTMSSLIILKGIFTWNNKQNDFFYAVMIILGTSIFLSFFLALIFNKIKVGKWK
jgi:hypothetical protein